MNMVLNVHRNHKAIWEGGEGVWKWGAIGVHAGVYTETDRVLSTIGVGVYLQRLTVFCLP